MRILYVSQDLDANIDREFARYRDAKISYTDCSSKVLMEINGIETIFSFDRDFETMGLARIP